LESFLIVARELPALCALFKYIHCTLVTPGRRVINKDYKHPTAVKLQEMSRVRLDYCMPTLKLRIETGNDRGPNSSAIKGFLEPFRTVAYGLQKVQVLNTGSHPELKE
jgi:hypothetical protein